MEKKERSTNKTRKKSESLRLNSKKFVCQTSLPQLRSSLKTNNSMRSKCECLTCQPKKSKLFCSLNGDTGLQMKSERSLKFLLKEVARSTSPMLKPWESLKTNLEHRFTNSNTARRIKLLSRLVNSDFCQPIDSFVENKSLQSSSSIQKWKEKNDTNLSKSSGEIWLRSRNFRSF